MERNVNDIAIQVIEDLVRAIIKMERDDDEPREVSNLVRGLYSQYQQTVGRLPVVELFLKVADKENIQYDTDIEFRDIWEHYGSPDGSPDG